MAKWGRHIIFVFLLLAFCLPVIQQNTGLVKVRGLKGAGDPPLFPSFSLASWFEGSFQQGTEKAIEQRVGFRPILIKIKNQMEFSLFNKANAKGVVVGKNKYLFESDYLRAFTGGDYPGDWYWTEKFRRAGLVRDTLKRLGVNTAVVIEPSKASYFEEYIPERFSRDSSIVRNNYKSIIDGCGNQNIPILDLYSYFTSMKELSPYPLFPKGGIHWSYYGMLTAMDTLLPMVGDWTGKEVPSISYINSKPEKKLRGTDGDLAELINVLVKPGHPAMSYPDIEYAQVSDSLKPRVLAISDSFYFNIINAGIPDSSYANTAFWYYNVEIYPETWSSRKDTTMINYRQEVESMDLVMIMITERFFYKFAWDFFDRLYNEYYPDEPVNYRYKYTKQVISHYLWFDQVVEEAANKGISVEQGLEDHSGFQFWQDEQKGKLEKNLSYYEMKIRHNADWMKQIREKAEKSGITIDQQIRLDAEWTQNNANK